MQYIFIVNGRKDRRTKADAVLLPQLQGADFPYKIYYTTGVGDGERYVRIWCDLHEKEEACFVACGGSGTTCEVAAGIVGFPGKSMAVLAFGASNDFLKMYPGRCFDSVAAIIKGTPTQIDVIKANDSYAINAANVGFDAMVAARVGEHIKEGVSMNKAVLRGLIECIWDNRFNRIKVYADGKRLNRGRILLCAMANGGWYGGTFHCAPDAVVDDGQLNVCLVKAMSLIRFIFAMRKYRTGDHITSPLFRGKLVYTKATHIDLISSSLIFMCLDGEIVASTSFSVDILPKAITLILPNR